MRTEGEFFVCLQITGGSSGIGKALAIEAVKRQANVSLLARNKVCLN
jgi:short-subunit dehydrogenase